MRLLTLSLRAGNKGNSKSSVAVLVQPADCDSAIVSIIENRQRDIVMLLYFLVPWILVTLLLASPLPDMLRARNVSASAASLRA